MKVLWFTWKDRSHPQAGGAEVVNEELSKRLVADGHEVVFVVGGYPGCSEEETRDGFKIIRVGNRYTLYFQAFRYYRKHLMNWPDITIEEINTIPFFSGFYIRSPRHSHENAHNPRHILFIHQLARQIWFYQMPFPISLIGYLLEPLYLRLLNSQQVITVSQSTKKDLLRRGFKPEHIHIISEGITLSPFTFFAGSKPMAKDSHLSPHVKYSQPTILALGAVRAMKRTAHVVKAFETAKKKIPELRLIVAGDTHNRYGKRVLHMIEKSPCKKDIIYSGKVGEQKKTELLQKSHILCSSSIKEGWGLTITEANSQGTTAVVYDTDGLRDSVQHGHTGLICTRNTPESMAANIVRLLNDHDLYTTLQVNAWEWSKQITFDRGYEDVKSVLGI